MRSALLFAAGFTAALLLGATQSKLHDSGGFENLRTGGFPPARCEVGDVWFDTDETVDTNCTTTADNSLCVCGALNVWSGQN